VLEYKGGNKSGGPVMPSPRSSDELLALVQKSGLLSEKRLQDYLTPLCAGEGIPAEAGRLAGLLIRDGLLTSFQAEQLLLGKWRGFTLGTYKVLERLSGTVYLCQHSRMPGRPVAIKVLPTALAKDLRSLARFHRQARALAALDHPNVVRAYDIDQDALLHFLVMEYVDGSSLYEIIRRTGTLSVPRASHYISQTALGLQDALEIAGVVHRKINPSHILVDRSGVVKVVGFGRARFLYDKPPTAYSVYVRSDINALGASLYYCLTGRRHRSEDSAPFRSLRPDVPEVFAAIVEIITSRLAAECFSTYQEVVAALAPFTQTPIPPPVEEEMPHLSPAARAAVNRAEPR
jgi:serine/threonine protein kinase